MGALRSTPKRFLALRLTDDTGTTCRIVRRVQAATRDQAIAALMRADVVFNFVAEE